LVEYRLSCLGCSQCASACGRTGSVRAASPPPVFSPGIELQPFKRVLFAWRAGGDVEAPMNTPLDIAVDIGRIIAEARARNAPLDFSHCVDEIFLRFPQRSVSRVDIREALKEEAGAVGLQQE
jgi:hypothetical protein